MFRYWVCYPSQISENSWEALLYPTIPKDINLEYCIVVNLSKIRDRVSREIDHDELEFSVSRAMEILGINRYTIHDWLQRGFLEPLGTVRLGRGKRMFFSRDDLYKMCLFKIVSDLGAGRSAAMILIKNFEINRTVLAK